MRPIHDDPAGKPGAAAGRKSDEEKPRMELLPMPELVEVAKALTYGAKKYAPDNWKAVPNAAQRYKGALLRHLAAMEEEAFDHECADACILHAAQVACNALFLLHFEMAAVYGGRAAQI